MNVSDGDDDDDDEDENYGTVAENVSEDDDSDDDVAEEVVGGDVVIVTVMDDVEVTESQASQSILPVEPTINPGPSNIDSNGTSTVSHNASESVNKESVNIVSSENVINNVVGESSSKSSLHKRKQSNVSIVKGISSRSKKIKKPKEKKGQLEHSQVAEGGTKGTDDEASFGGCLEQSQITSELSEDGQRVNTPLLQTEANDDNHSQMSIVHNLEDQLPQISANGKVLESPRTSSLVCGSKKTSNGLIM